MHAMAQRNIAEHIGNDHHQNQDLSFSGVPFSESRALDWFRRSSLHSILRGSVECGSKAKVYIPPPELNELSLQVAPRHRWSSFTYAAIVPMHWGCEQPQLLLKLPPSAASEQAWLQYSWFPETGQVHFG
jgi:hypothetical protein